jgi:Flp pilus assembly protein protease CpaA
VSARTQRRSPARIVFVLVIVVVVLAATSHGQAALWVGAAAAVYALVEGILAWRRR